MRPLLAAFAIVSIVMAPIAARAEFEACTDAAEDGQKARAAGQLRLAREKFLACGVDACPAVVRQDCVRWAGEVLESMPTIIIDAKDQSGADVGDVTVVMDDFVLAKKLDGKAIAVDPGRHVFRFERFGSPSVSQTVIVKEMAKGRTLSVTFTATSTEASAEKPAPQPSHGAGVVPWLLAGMGLALGTVGVIVIATAPAVPPNCNKETERCSVPLSDPYNPKSVPVAPACTGPNTPAGCYDLGPDQDKAGVSKSQPILGIELLVVGGAVLATGVIWYLVARPREPSTAIAPWISPGSAGVSGSARF